MKTAQTIAQQQAAGKSGENAVRLPKGKHPNSLKNLVAPWKPGESGNPAGRPKDLAAMISRAIFEQNGAKIYEGAAAKILGGDAYAFSVHADRGYGKLKQGIVHTGDEDGGPIKTEVVVSFKNVGESSS